jgi:hypothetical protein
MLASHQRNDAVFCFHWYYSNLIGKMIKCDLYVWWDMFSWINWLIIIIIIIKIIFFLNKHKFTSFFPIAQQACQAVVPHRLSVIKYLWLYLRCFLFLCCWQSLELGVVCAVLHHMETNLNVVIIVVVFIVVVVVYVIIIIVVSLNQEIRY